MKKNLFAYGFSLLFISIVIYIFLRSDYLILLSKISVFELIISMAIALVIFSVSGSITGLLTKEQYKTRLTFIDIVTLPLMMNFWSFIIPLKGGSVYSILFLKSKYKIKLVEGASMSLYTHMICFSLIGFFGLMYSFSQQYYFSLFTVLCLALLLNPFLIKNLIVILQKYIFCKKPPSQNIIKIINAFFSSYATLWKNTRLTLIVILLTIMRFAFRVVWYYWAVTVFEIQIELTTLITIALTMEMTRMIHVTPGNIGFNELLSGGVFTFLGRNTAEGILVALFLRFSSLLLTFSLGLISILSNIKYFEMKNFQSVLSSLKTGGEKSFSQK